MPRKHSLTEAEYKNLRINIEVLHTTLSQRCMDCKLPWHPLVMTLDHRDRSTKSGDISKMRILNPVVFMAELNKCDAVCRNCHQMREYLRDMNTMVISDRKKLLYKYYARITAFLKRGALLYDDAFDKVSVKDYQ